jgi:hypothetical protein
VGLGEGAVLRLRIERTWCGPVCTIGTLYADGKAECFTLEDPIRPNGEKVEGDTAIPEGIYGVVITPSKRFQRDMPLLQNVPGFEGIRIHPGNTAADTKGCILVGAAKMPGAVTHSREAYERLFQKIKESLGAGRKSPSK